MILGCMPLDSREVLVRIIGGDEGAHLVAEAVEEDGSVQSSAGSICNPYITQILELFFVSCEHMWNHTNRTGNCVCVSCVHRVPGTFLRAFCVLSGSVHSCEVGIIISVSGREGFSL